MRSKILTALTAVMMGILGANGADLNTDRIEQEILRIDLIDGKADSSITLKDKPSTKRANRLYFDLISEITQIVENEVTSIRLQHLYIDETAELLGKINKYNIERLFYFEQLFGHIKGSVAAKANDKLESYLLKRPIATLKTFGIFKDERCAEPFLMAVLKNEPLEVLRNFKRFNKQPYAIRVVESVVKVAPSTAKNFMTGSGSIGWVVNRSTDQVVAQFKEMYRNYGKQSNPYLFLDQVAALAITGGQAKTLWDKKEEHLNYLLDIRHKAQPLGKHSIDNQLTYICLDKIRVINELHENKNPAVRYKSVEGATAEELYALMVYTQDEIFTSSFIGLFKRWKAALPANNGYSFLQSVNFNRFRTFVTMCAGFGQLDDLLSTMSAAEKEQLLTKFVSNLEDEKGNLTHAIDVADALASIKNAEQIQIIETALKQHLELLKKNNHEDGIVIYSLLAELFADKEGFDFSWFKNLSKAYELPYMDKINGKTLYNDDEVNVQLHYFYDDRDGAVSFAGFLSTFKKGNWQIIDKGYYVLIKSTEGNNVEIYANKPQNEVGGQDKLEAFLRKQDKTPHIVVHRGHSYYLHKTIERIPPSVKIVLLGSCGSYHHITKAIERSPGTHIISSKQIASLRVNNPLLYALAEDMRNSYGLYWPKFWEDLGTQLSGNQRAYKSFVDYIPPHKNLGAIFVQAYWALTE